MYGKSELSNSFPLIFVLMTKSSAKFKIFSGHSGSAMIYASGFLTFAFTNSLSEKVS